MGYLINQPVNKQKKRWDFDHYTQSYWYFIRNHHAPVVQKIDNAIQRIRIRETNCTNHWTEIYPMYSAIRLFTVLYLSARLSRSSALCYGLPSSHDCLLRGRGWFERKRAIWKGTFENQDGRHSMVRRAISRQSHEKLGDWEQSIVVSTSWTTGAWFIFVTITGVGTAPQKIFYFISDVSPDFS